MNIINKIVTAEYQTTNFDCESIVGADNKIADSAFVIPNEYIGRSNVYDSKAPYTLLNKYQQNMITEECYAGTEEYYNSFILYVVGRKINSIEKYRKK